MSGGTNDSAAVVTAAMRSSRSRPARPRGRPPPLLEQPDHVRRIGRELPPAGVGRTPRPSRSSSCMPTSRDSAVTAADTDGWVTTSASAAAVTDPPRTTARKLRSCVSVIDIAREA